jgi:hypothetical protein
VSWEGERGLGWPAGGVGGHCELGGERGLGWQSKNYSSVSLTPANTCIHAYRETITAFKIRQLKQNSVCSSVDCKSDSFSWGAIL